MQTLPIVEFQQVKVADRSTVVVQHVDVLQHDIVNRADSYKKVLHKALLNSSALGSHGQWVLCCGRTFCDLCQESDKLNFDL